MQTLPTFPTNTAPSTAPMPVRDPRFATTMPASVGGPAITRLPGAQTYITNQVASRSRVSDSVPQRSLSPTPGQFNTYNNQTIRNAVISQPLGSFQGAPISAGTISQGAIAANAIKTTNVAMAQQQGHLGVTSANLSVGGIAGKPASSSRIQYIPYQRRITEYETKQIVTSMWVPVQRKCLNYYAIQNITEYLPREIQDVRYEMVPQQQLSYRLQYIPIQRDIIHLPKEEHHVYANSTALYDVNRTYAGLHNQRSYSMYGAGNTLSRLKIPGYQQISNTISNTTRLGPAPKSNFVTTDGYVPSYLQYNPIPSLPLQPTQISGSRAQEPTIFQNKQITSGLANFFKSNMGSNNQTFEPSPQNKQISSSLASFLKNNLPPNNSSQQFQPSQPPPAPTMSDRNVFEVFKNAVKPSYNQGISSNPAQTRFTDRASSFQW